MAPTEIRVGQLTRWTGRKGHLYVRTLRPEMSPETRRRLGVIFGVIRAAAADQVGEALAAHIEDAAIRGGAEAIRRLPAEATQEQVFEATVARINGTLTRLLEDGRLPIAPDLVAGALVSQHEREIVAAVWGDPSLLLFHPAKDGLRIFDLLDDGETDREATVRTGRGFTHLVAGQIGPDDKLVVATANLCDAFPPAKLAPIVADNAPDQISLILREILNQANSPLSLSIVVADCVEKRAAADESAKRMSSATQNSIEALLDTESRTKDILTTSALQSAFRRAGAGLKWIFTQPAKPKPTAPRSSRVSPPETDMTEVLPAEPKTEIQAGAVRLTAEPRPEETSAVRTTVPPDAASKPVAVKTSPPVIKPTGPSTLTLAWRAAKNWNSQIFSLLSSPERRRAAVQSHRQAAADRLNRFIDRYNALNSQSKGLLLAALLVLQAFNLNLTYAAWQHGREESLARYDQAVAAIEQKIDSAQASLIYRDENRARQLLDEATAAVTALPGLTTSQKTTQKRLNQEIQDKREAMRHAAKLGAPDVIATVATGDAAPEITRLLTVGRNYWAVAASGEIFRIDAASGTASRVGQVPGASGMFSAPAGDGIVVGTSDGKLTQFAAGGRQYDKSADFSGFEVTVADAASYLDRLYLLDAVHNRILRLNPTDTGYGRPQHYLKDSTDVSHTVSLAVDGDVWLIRGDGQVMKLTKGEHVPFVLGSIDPPLVSPQKIRTVAGFKALYILADSPKRLAAFDKTNGQLIVQLESDALTGASDFYVDETNQKLIVAVGNRLLRFSLPEME